RTPGERPPAPVKVSPIEHGPISLLRTFSGTLEPGAEFVVSPKLSGRVEEILFEIGDPITRGSVVAHLDRDELEQTLIQVEADLLVAKANLAEARSALEISQREIERTSTLFDRGVASDSELDAAKTNLLATEAKVEVFEAQLTRAEAAVRAANIRIAYARVTAEWPEGDSMRLVAERYLDAGQTVAANEPLLRIVDIHPLVGVIHVTERDYARLTPGQAVHLTTDAYPGEIFEGMIARIAPVFRSTSRQARVELTIPNADHRLKPGMFVRATVELEREPDAVIVPEAALVTRQDTEGVFLVSPDGTSVQWQPVAAGIREGDRLQIVSPPLRGEVVTLGQQLIDDGSLIRIAGETAPVKEEVTGG
ncbi:MAG TPA: efflux RND transporter periplasmic adaptor subunit, partial [Opitutales bacterium]|nr:efflux RND transporter periplasmic adaptor subunit [Opitutales bacterium]